MSKLQIALTELAKQWRERAAEYKTQGEAAKRSGEIGRLMGMAVTLEYAASQIESLLRTEAP